MDLTSEIKSSIDKLEKIGFSGESGFVNSIKTIGEGLATCLKCLEKLLEKGE